MREQRRAFEEFLAEEALRVLNILTKNGELRDYDDELANRLEDAKHIIRAYPDMLKALRVAQAALAQTTQDSLYDNAKATVHAAIIKADGRHV